MLSRPGKPKQKAKKKGMINFDFLQKLGKVLMQVIAVMPAAGLMISLGKLVQMAGADMAVVIGLIYLAYCLIFRGEDYF